MSMCEIPAPSELKTEVLSRSDKLSKSCTDEKLLQDAATLAAPFLYSAYKKALETLAKEVLISVDSSQVTADKMLLICTGVSEKGYKAYPVVMVDATGKDLLYIKFVFPWF